MQYRIIPVTHYQQNTTLLWDEHTLEAALVDPGGDVPRLLAAVEEHALKLTKILLTHGHLDHVGGTEELARRFNLPIEGPHPDDAFWLNSLDNQAQWMQFAPVNRFTPSRWLHHGDLVQLGSQTLEVLHCPGHTPGHVVFFSRPSGLLIVGDVLFAGSIGRTDFPRGNHAQLLHSITQHLWPLGDEVKVLPGHGPTTTIGQERRTNPFVADAHFG